MDGEGTRRIYVAVLQGGRSRRRVSIAQVEGSTRMGTKAMDAGRIARSFGMKSNPRWNYYWTGMIIRKGGEGRQRDPGRRIGRQPAPTEFLGSFSVWSRTERERLHWMRRTSSGCWESRKTDLKPCPLHSTSNPTLSASTSNSASILSKSFSILQVKQYLLGRDIVHLLQP